jgi:hypothetical protein
LLTDLQQRVADTGQRLVEACGVEQVVEAERVEVGLVGQVERRRWAGEADQLQIRRGGVDAPGREPFACYGDGVVGGVADPEAAGGWVEPVACMDGPGPVPAVGRVGVDAPPGACGRGRAQPGRPLFGEAGQD